MTSTNATTTRTSPNPPLRFDLRAKRLGWLVGLLVFMLACMVLSICFGSRDITFSTVMQSFVDFDPGSSEHLLVRQLRVPRTLLALLVGLSLGVAGAIMQALTRNPLAEPGLLGINSGAALAIAGGIAIFGITDVLGYMWLGLIGGAIAGCGVYLLGGAHKGTNPVRLVLAGAALSVVLLAMTQIIILNSPDTVLDRYRNWVTGSVAGRGFEVLGPVTLIALAGLVLAATLIRPLNAVTLGEDMSRSLGASPTRTWALAGVAVIVLSGAATAAAGPISFIGLASPHLARMIVGVDQRWVLPFSGAIGAALLIAADTIGRIIAQPGEVSAGIMAALLGGPFFIYLVRHRRIAQL